MPEGLITKALSGYYYVMPADDFAGTIECRGRGILKKRGIAPLVGDRVIYELTGNGEGAINELLLPRKSELIRPAIVNVDLAVLVFSVVQPPLNLPLLDKFLVHTEHAGIEALICFSKYDLIQGIDLSDQEGLQVEEIIQLYERCGYKVMTISSVSGEGTQAMQDYLKGRITVFSGQSGVGKSSMLNSMVPGLQLGTNIVSVKGGRGKHTTRHVELFPLPNGGVVADTPGFSQLDFADIELDDLKDGFKEFSRYAPNCKFRGCLHQHEPKCQVIAAKEQGEIAATRYEHYLSFLDEVKEKKRRY